MVSSQTGDSSFPKQSTSEQTCELGAKCMHSEPSEVNHLLGSEAVENEPRETSSAANNGVINVKQKLFSGEALDNSFNKCLGLPAENVSKSIQANEISYPLQTTSEQKHEFGTEHVHSEQSEQADNIVLNENGETSTAMYSIVDDNKLGPISEDVCNNSQRDTEQTLEFGFGHECNELDTECKHSEPSEQKDQLGSGIILNEPAEVNDMVPTSGVEGNLQPYSEDLTKICHSEPLEPPPEDGIKCTETGENSCPQHPISEQTPEFAARIRSCEALEANHKVGSELLHDKPVETSTTISCYIATEQLGPSLDLVIKSSPIEHLKPPPEVSTMIPSAEHSAPSSDDMARNCLEELETQAKRAVKNFKHVGHKGNKTSKSLNKKYTLRSLTGSDRVLRSRSQEKPKAPKSNNNLADVSSHGEKKRKTNNKKKGGRTIIDDYSRIRAHLRYLLNRINYEKSLIDAYSGEGWKGLSLEKLKPEKELQRATSEILRRKLKIRDLFRHLDSLCAEGTLPTSLFDSEGQIDSEDIFCAKCGSKDLSLDNDIILCDGACDRGFHQYCLEPPLLKEDIPPDDEGWLCPGCNCKVDCIDSVNDSQGTNLCITDNWEKVFPEAAAAAGQNQDPNFGLPSDDSDDNDYNPDGSAADEKDQGDESSSDESNYVSASDEPKAAANDNVYLGLPSDDSEDDNYDPDAPEPDEKVMQDSSSSDFTSDSEDLAAVLEDDRTPGNEGTTSASPLRDTNGRRLKEDTELLNILESEQDEGTSVYEKRGIERLDYKKLYDETFGNLSSNSSDDEDWTDNDPSMIGEDDEDWTDNVPSRIGEGSPVSANGNACTVRNQKTRKDVNQDRKKTEGPCKRKPGQNLNSDDTNISPAKSHEDCSKPGSSDKRSKSSSKRLGEHVTQRLYNSFKQEQYPDRTTKESLVKELGLTFRQVSKWFENARWSFNHSSSMPMDTRTGKSDPKKGTSLPRLNGTENAESSKARVDAEDCTNTNVRDNEMKTQENNREECPMSTSRKRKRKSELGNQASDPKSGIKADSSKAQETQSGGRVLRSRRKSDA
ncbi:hypothetical protein ACOSQ3_005247 [Xanthoceras sorbifolium]